MQNLRNHTTLPILLTTLFTLLSTSSQHQTCSEDFTLLTQHHQIKHCKKLPTLEAEFAWNLTEHPNKTNTIKLDILFAAPLKNEIGWLAWGVNPTNRSRMIGTRAIIGIRFENGSMGIDTYNITRFTKKGCELKPSVLDFRAVGLKIEYFSNNSYFLLFGTLYLPMKEYNVSRLNHVWQVGERSDGMMPLGHPRSLHNVDSVEVLDMWTGESQGIGPHRRRMRVAHGILNILGWGVFLPLGAMQPRYFRLHPFKSQWWFILHVGFQMTGYLIGTVGFIIGLWLGHTSRYYTFHKHRSLSIFIFTFASVQMTAMRLKPKKSDEYRKFWNLYHHFSGYLILIAISVNIFLGIGIFKITREVWKRSYIGIMGTFGLLWIAFEIYSWTKYLAMKKPEKEPVKEPQPSS